MPVVLAELRRGAYADSAILMQLQRSLQELPGVRDAAVLMGTPANLELLQQAGLWTAEAAKARADDLVIVVQAETETVARSALSQIDELRRRRSSREAGHYRPRSLETALRTFPEARFASISVPGAYAADLTREALAAGLHVFLYSDNVPLSDEVELKKLSASRGQLLMGPDCGTSILGGVGLGFANRVRRGSIGLIGASGTGLQALSCMIDALGAGVSQAIGSGGRDLHEAVGGVTTRQAMRLLAEDPDTGVLVLVSKPPARRLAGHLIGLAASIAKPVVIDFLGFPPPAPRLGNIHFASTLEEAARRAVELSGNRDEGINDPLPPGQFAPPQRWLRGLFAGGTLALEILPMLRALIGEVDSNLEAEPSSLTGDGHRIVDLGSDEFTAGRLHPMLDQTLRIRGLLQEADDPGVAVILLDVVLGDGAHPDPAAELAPAVARAKQRAREAGRNLEVVVLVIGAKQDPQGRDRQVARLEKAEARVEASPAAAALLAARFVKASGETPQQEMPPVDRTPFQGPPAIVNLGLESFYESLIDQGAAAIQVDWRPPAGGDQRLSALLRKMK